MCESAYCCSRIKFYLFWILHVKFEIPNAEIRISEIWISRNGRLALAALLLIKRAPSPLMTRKYSGTLLQMICHDETRSAVCLKRWNGVRWSQIAEQHFMTRQTASSIWKQFVRTGSACLNPAQRARRSDCVVARDRLAD